MHGMILLRPSHTIRWYVESQVGKHDVYVLCFQVRRHWRCVACAFNDKEVPEKMIILKQMMHSIWLQEPSPAYPGIHSTHTYAALPHKQILHFASDKFCRIWSKDLVSTFIYRSRKLTCLKDIGSIGVRLPHQHQHTHKTDKKKKKTHARN